MTDYNQLRDRVLTGEIVKLTDERLAEIQHIATSDTVQHPNSTRWHWLAVVNELIAARKEIERLTKAAAPTDTVPRSRYDACNRDWLAAENECTRIAARAKEESERLTARVAELEKERDASAEDTRAMQERLQRAVQGAMTLRRALDIIVNIRPLGGPTYPECYSRMRAVALDALGDDGPPGPKHPPRVPGHNPVA